MIPRATYRFQFHRDFTFADAERLVPYLEALGISHIYASPVTTARAGSMHGYDVVDPTRVNPELGGENALRSLVGALRERGMGLIIDIVPNHMGVAGGENAWWNDVLAHGPDSAFVHYFDIDWSTKLLLPILGTPLSEALAQGAIAITQTRGKPELLVYGEYYVPLRSDPPTDLPSEGESEDLAALIEHQHYTLAWWRVANDMINWRRFFTINDLAGLRVENPAVFEATHTLYMRLWGEGLIDGVRIDHVDGLSDPASYLERLRERFAGIARPAGVPPGPAYIVVEKILGPGERLPAAWPVEGTSGYDFMDDASAVLHDPAGQEALAALWHSFSGRSLDFLREEFRGRRQLLDWSFQAQLEACVDAFVDLAASSPATAGLTRAMLRRAMERVLWVFPVYRTYGTGTCAPPEDEAVRETARAAALPYAAPGEAAFIDTILAWLAGDGPGEANLAERAVRRFQQLCAPLAAKGVEDTAFYRHGVLLSRVDVGFDAAQFALTPDQFLQRAADRAKRSPHAMLATATHDHKRGEDVRARLSVLSHIPAEWEAAVRDWDRLASGKQSDVDPADRYIFWQTLFGAWPEDLVPGQDDALCTYCERVSDWQVKALREAKLRSTWALPDETYEARCTAFTTHVCAPASQVVPAIAAFVQRTQAGATAAMLGQMALRYLLPGVPDLYQGCELPDLSLVDPDNRKPVDYAQRRAMLAGEQERHPKFGLLLELLALCRDEPELFTAGELLPARTTGLRHAAIVAFSRRHDDAALDCAVLVGAGSALLDQAEPIAASEWWGDTTISFAPAGGPEVQASVLFEAGPVAVKLRCLGHRPATAGAAIP